MCVGVCVCVWGVGVGMYIYMLLLFWGGLWDNFLVVSKHYYLAIPLSPSVPTLLIHVLMCVQQAILSSTNFAVVYDEVKCYNNKYKNDAFIFCYQRRSGVGE